MNKQICTSILILLIHSGMTASQETPAPNDVPPNLDITNENTLRPPESKEDKPGTPKGMASVPSLKVSETAEEDLPPPTKMELKPSGGSVGPSPYRMRMPNAPLAPPFARDEGATGFDDATCFKPPTYCFWGGVEGLYWWEKKQPLPPSLIATGSPTDASPGVLGQPNTQVVFGPNELGYGGFIGIRASVGMWLDPQQNLGFETSGFILENRNAVVRFASAAGGYPLLALRGFDAGKRTPDAFLIAAPAAPGSNVNAFAGGVVLQSSSQLWGAEDNLLHALYLSRQFRLVALVGFRYLELSEKLNIQTNTSDLDNSTLSFLGVSSPSAVQGTTDSFRTQNQFYGCQVGLRGDYFYQQFFVRVGGMLALGGTDEISQVAGVTSFLAHNALPLTAPGGLYALPSNSGRFRNQDFSVIPALQLKAGVLLTSWCRATIGYDYLYWSRVLRPGNQIDLTQDQREIPTSKMYQAGIEAASPRPMTNQSDFWVQGLTFGLEFTF